MIKFDQNQTQITNLKTVTSKTLYKCQQLKFQIRPVSRNCLNIGNRQYFNNSDLEQINTH